MILGSSILYIEKCFQKVFIQILLFYVCYVVGYYLIIIVDVLNSWAGVGDETISACVRRDGWLFTQKMDFVDVNHS